MNTRLPSVTSILAFMTSLGVTRLSNAACLCKINKFVMSSADPMSEILSTGANHHSTSKSFSSLCTFDLVILMLHDSAILDAMNKDSSIWYFNIDGVGVLLVIIIHVGGSSKLNLIEIQCYYALQQ